MTMNKPTTSQTKEGQERGVKLNRRNILKTAGVAGGGLVALSASAGTAVAGDTPDQLYFCGCSQVVVTGLIESSSITVYLRATEEGGCRTITVDSPDCEVGGGREYAFRYTYSGGEAILAVGTPDGNIWCNPNNCAQKWLDELTCFDGISGSLRSECTDYSELDPPGDVFTNRCGTACRGN